MAVKANDCGEVEEAKKGRLILKIDRLGWLGTKLGGAWPLQHSNVLLNAHQFLYPFNKQNEAGITFRLFISGVKRINNTMVFT